MKITRKIHISLRGNIYFDNYVTVIKKSAEKKMLRHVKFVKIIVSLTTF